MYAVGGRGGDVTVGGVVGDVVSLVLVFVCYMLVMRMLLVLAFVSEVI